MINTNKIIKNIIGGTSTTVRRKSVRKSVRQNIILPVSGIDEVYKLDVFLRDHSQYGDKWNEELEKNKTWNEEWDVSELSIKSRDKLIKLAEKFIKKYNLSKEYKSYKSS